jgi:hypothetical protein
LSRIGAGFVDAYLFDPAATEIDAGGNQPRLGVGRTGDDRIHATRTAAEGSRAQTHKVHHTTAATRHIEARKFLASLS